MELSEIKKAIQRELRIIEADCANADRLENPVGCDSLTLTACERLHVWVYLLASVRKQFCDPV